MAAIVSVRKIGNTVERMDGCKSSIEIIILTSKKKMHDSNIYRNKDTTTRIITLTMVTANSPMKLWSMKLKIVQEQWLQLKIKFLLGDNTKIHI